MATQPVSDGFVSVEEYLSTSYDPDCEYDDGVVVERNLGEIEHAFLQGLLTTLFNVHAESWGIYCLPEQRVQIKPRRFLVPDVCVVPLKAPWQRILTVPPLIVIEVLSPEDTLRRAEDKVREYLEFGVEHVWVIDPYARVAYRGGSAGLELQASGELAVPETPIKVRIAELFEKLDRVRAQAGKE
ncbi:MAG TPA: Uma2 family endonuclease [Terracidiphilus sp.]|jgi:Uma2 family endonuclease|nr:Uma2 family endonuclease [Terracidiphilus sp.]